MTETKQTVSEGKKVECTLSTEIPVPCKTFLEWLQRHELHASFIPYFVSVTEGVNCDFTINSPHEIKLQLKLLFSKWRFHLDRVTHPLRLPKFENKRIHFEF